MNITAQSLKVYADKNMTAANGIILQGVLWLWFWLGPAFFLFQEDPRWGHNFAIPIIFITVGIAYHVKKISCQLTAFISAFFLVPTLLAFWPWKVATIIASVFLGIFIILYLLERGRETELINPNPRFRLWLRNHMMTFAYLGLVHMSLIYFLVRWQNPDPFLTHLPVEHDVPTTIFNAMLFILVPLAIMERFVKKIWGFPVTKVGFIWAILMMIIPYLTIVLHLE